MENVLKLRARHFKGSDFSSNDNCAVAKASMELWDTHDVNVSTTYVCVNNSRVFKMEYTYAFFKEDSAIALGKGYSDEILRSVKLTVD